MIPSGRGGQMFLGVCLLTLAGGGYLVVSGVQPAATNADTDSSATATEPSLDVELLEAEIHAEVNDRREAHGRAPLERNEALDRAARSHSRTMQIRGEIGHEGRFGTGPTDRVRRQGLDCRAAENAASGYFARPARWPDGDVRSLTSERRLAKWLVEIWMQSPPHRENLLSEQWTVEGIGVSATATDGPAQVYVTQDLC